jgi:hypothetical protein
MRNDAKNASKDAAPGYQKRFKKWRGFVEHARFEVEAPALAGFEVEAPCWDIGYVSEPDLIRPLGGEFLGEPVRGNGPIVAAVGGACPEPARRYRLDTVMAHEAFDPATARRVPQAAQGRVDPRRAIASTMCQMEALDLGEQSAIGRLA